MEQPELLVLQYDLLQVLERDDDWVNLAQLAQFEELDRRDLVTVARKVLEDCQ